MFFPDHDRLMQLTPAIEVSVANDAAYITLKRIIDIIGAICGLIVFAPILVLASILIKFTSRGPVIHRQKRLGKDGEVFTFYKLRSMYHNAGVKNDDLAPLNELSGPAFKLSNDPRITLIGRFLRKTSIDEIPQFVNIIKGEMSLVGPRPPLPEEAMLYNDWHYQRLLIKPGLTCFWQVGGRSEISDFDEWVRLDLEYIQSRCLWLDLKLLALTIPAVLSTRGAR